MGEQCLHVESLGGTWDRALWAMGHKQDTVRCLPVTGLIGRMSHCEPLQPSQGASSTSGLHRIPVKGTRDITCHSIPSAPSLFNIYLFLNKLR